MNKFLILTILMVSLTNTALAECTEESSKTEVVDATIITTDVPNHLKGATITVTLADGKSSTVPAELFKVVPRKQEKIVTKVQNTKVVSCTNNITSKNRVSALGGYGSQGGLNVSNNGSRVEVESKMGAVGGLQYQRLLTDELSVGVQVQTNSASSLLIGFDF